MNLHPMRRRLRLLVVSTVVALVVLSCHGDASEPLGPLAETAPSQQAVALAATDRGVLVEFYLATGGDGWQRRDG